MKAYMIILALAGTTAAQNPSPLAADFDYIVNKIETNYAGFSDKVTPATRASYESVTEETKKKLAAAKPEEALSILEAWLHFFKDHHLSIDKVSEPTTGATLEVRALIDETTFLSDEPIDNIGIQPDFPIDDSVEDQVSPVQAWLEKQVDF